MSKAVVEVSETELAIQRDILQAVLRRSAPLFAALAAVFIEDEHALGLPQARS
jgi:hypothetical protein